MIQYRRNLPHIHPPGATFFITFRLAGTLPQHVINELRANMNKEIKQCVTKYGKNRKQAKNEAYRIQKRYFGKFGHLLDNPKSGPVWLQKPEIAAIVINKIHELDGDRYHVIAYTIMPNHVHLVIQMIENENSEHRKTVVGRKRKNYPLAKAMQLLKGSTSRKCNIALGRSGNFWHHESYDHYVRDEEELHRIIEYVLNNPVKAGLVSHWREWKFSYCSYL